MSPMQHRAKLKSGSPSLSGILLHLYLRVLAQWTGAAQNLAGLLVLIGWVFAIPSLKNIFPERVFSTSACRVWRGGGGVRYW